MTKGKTQGLNFKYTLTEISCILPFDPLYLEVIDGTTQEGEHTTETDVAFGRVLIFVSAVRRLQEVSYVFPGAAANYFALCGFWIVFLGIVTDIRVEVVNEGICIFEVCRFRPLSHVTGHAV